MLNLARGSLASLLLIGLLLVAPSAARAGWVECWSEAPGELEVGVLLTMAETELDPAVESVVWRTIGPTEKEFYWGPKVNFGTKITGLSAGVYSITYEYRGPNGIDVGSFCTLRVAGGEQAAPSVEDTPPSSDNRGEAGVKTTPLATDSYETALVALDQPNSETIEGDPIIGASSTAVHALPADVPREAHGSSPLMVVGMLCLLLSASLALFTRTRGQR